MKYILDYLKHFYLAMVILLASLAGYSFVSGRNVVQRFEDQYDYQVTAYGFNPSNEYWNKETKTIVTEEGSLKLLHGETTDGFVFLDEAGRSRNLILLFEFEANEDDVKPYNVLKNNFILYQNEKELSDGGITNDNDSKIYQDVMNAGVSFYKKGDKIIGARAIAYQPNGGPVSIVINGTEYPISDLINIYEQETANKLRDSGELIELNPLVEDKEESSSVENNKED